MDGAEHELGGLDRVAVGERAVDLEAVARVEGEHLGAGALLQAGHAGEVVDVGVGAGDPADAVAAAAGDGVEVLGVVGPGIDHDDLVDADEVGVGAGAGHQARVVGDDAPHQRAQRAGHARARSASRSGTSAVVGVGHGEPLGRRPPWPGSADDSSSSQVAKRPMSWRLTIGRADHGEVAGPVALERVGGRTHSLPMISPSSWA